jgi:hypothetical protein
MPDAPAHACVAHGCPLRATIFDSVGGPAQNGRCRYHDVANRRDWLYLTEILQSRAFVREEIEPALVSIGLNWHEPRPPPSSAYYSAHTGITVSDYDSFKAWWHAFKRNPPPCPHKDAVGTFVRLGAILESVQFDREAAAERAAIQAEGV